MDTEVLKRIIKENQNFAKNVKLMYREFHFETYGNYVFIGIRRAGKSYLMFQRIQELIKSGTRKEEILYINFEDDRLINFKTEDFENLKNAYHQLYDPKPIFFLDEIQIVEGWEKFVRRLADQKYTVYVTGSNAKMLSSEIMTTLGGRFLIKDVYPFSLKEYLDYNKVKINTKDWIYDTKIVTDVARKTDEYFYYGGFPELNIYDDKRQWLSSLYQKIFFGDLISRYAVKNPNVLRIMIGKVAESVMQPATYNRMASIVSASGYKVKPDTVAEYCQYLIDSYLVFPVENFAAKLQDKVSVRKYYFSDNGIISLFVSDATSLLLENLVAIVLRKKYPDELAYFSTNVEVDFYLPEQKISFQVSYSIKDQTTYQREVRALVKLNSYIPQNKMFIITNDEEGVIEDNGCKIYVVPLWKWCLEDGQV